MSNYYKTQFVHSSVNQFNAFEGHAYNSNRLIWCSLVSVICVNVSQQTRNMNAIWCSGKNIPISILSTMCKNNPFVCYDYTSEASQLTQHAFNARLNFCSTKCALRVFRLFLRQTGKPKQSKLQFGFRCIRWMDYEWVFALASIARLWAATEPYIKFAWHLPSAQRHWHHWDKYYLNKFIISSRTNDWCRKWNYRIIDINEEVHFHNSVFFLQEGKRKKFADH